MTIKNQENVNQALGILWITIVHPGSVSHCQLTQSVLTDQKQVAQGALPGCQASNSPHTRIAVHSGNLLHFSLAKEKILGNNVLYLQNQFIRATMMGAVCGVSKGYFTPAQETAKKKNITQDSSCGHFIIQLNIKFLGCQCHCNSIKLLLLTQQTSELFSLTVRPMPQYFINYHIISSSFLPF